MKMCEKTTVRLCPAVVAGAPALSVVRHCPAVVAGAPELSVLFHVMHASITLPAGFYPRPPYGNNVHACWNRKSSQVYSSECACLMPGYISSACAFVQRLSPCSAVFDA
jgi:hypothetical protein